MPAPECQNQSCKFGAHGGPNKTDGPEDMFCVFHKDKDTMIGYTSHQQRSLVRSVRNFIASGRKETVNDAYAVLNATVPGLGDQIRDRVDRLENEDKRKGVKEKKRNIEPASEPICHRETSVDNDKKPNTNESSSSSCTQIQ